MAVDLPGLLLGVHIAAGVAGLSLGPLSLVAHQRQRWAPALATAYQVAVAVLTTTALGLVVRAPGRLWWLVPFAVGTEAAVLCAWWLQRRGSGGASPWRVRLLGGSYVSLITALLVVNWNSPLSWVLPSLAGAVAVERAAARAGRTARQACS